MRVPPSRTTCKRVALELLSTFERLPADTAGLSISRNSLTSEYALDALPPRCASFS